MDAFTLSIVAILLGVVNTYLVLKLYVLLKQIPDITGIIDVITTVLGLLRTKASPDEQDKLAKAEQILKEILDAIQKKQSNEQT
jgi:hypothetical protein